MVERRIQGITIDHFPKTALAPMDIIFLAIRMPLDTTTTPPPATAIGAPNMAAIAPAWNPAAPLNPQHRD